MHGCGPAACCRPGAAEHTERLRLRQRGRPRPRAGLRRECRCSRVPVESSGPMRISCGHRSPASGRARTDVRRLRAAGESPQAMSEATAALLPRGMHPPKRMGVGNTRGTRRGARPPGAGAAGRVRGATEHEARGRVAGEPRTPRMRSGAPAKATGSSMAPPGPRYRAGPQTKRGARAAGDSNDEEIMKHAKKHADDLIEMLATAIEAQSAPWQKPWKCDARLPTNLITGKVYTGRNLLMLATVRALKAYDDHRWAGFQQIKSAGGHVRRGERGHWICIMRTVGAARAAGQNDVDLDQESDGSLSGPGRRRTTRGYTYTTFRPVWNASQCENIAPLEEAEATDEGKRRRILAGEGRHQAAQRRVLPQPERRGPAPATRAVRRAGGVLPDCAARTGARHGARESARPPPRREPVRLRAVHPRGTRDRGAGVPGEHERRPRAQPGSTPCWGSTARTTRRRSEVLPYLYI